MHIFLGINKINVVSIGIIIVLFKIVLILDADYYALNIDTLIIGVNKIIKILRVLKCIIVLGVDEWKNRGMYLEVFEDCL